MTATTTEDIAGAMIEIGDDDNGLELLVVHHPDHGLTVDLLPIGRADARDEGLAIRLSLDLVRQLAAVFGDEVLAER